MSSFLIPMLAFFLLYVFTIASRTSFLNASSLFIYMQLIMAIGTLPLLDETIEADVVHGMIIAGTFLVFIGVTGVSCVVSSRRQSLQPRASFSPYRPSPLIWALIVFSIAVCTIYYFAVGYFALFESLKSVLSGASDDVAALRLESYSGSTYFFPGYVNQFKNALLPSLVVVATISFFTTRHPLRWPLSSVLILLSLLFILGTGQRGAFVTFMIVMIITISLLDRARFVRILPPLVLIAAPLFMLSTVASGRANSELRAAESEGDQFLALLGQIFFRIFGSNQEASIAGFRYIHAQGVQNGREWLVGLLGILPGSKGSDLDQRIYAELYGSMRGSAPPSIWGSAYLNFGAVGALLFAALLAVLLHFVGARVAAMDHINSMQAVGIGGVTTVLGTWVAGGPLVLFNVGIVVYLFLWWWGGRRNSDTFASSRGRLSIERRKVALRRLP